MATPMLIDRAALAAAAFASDDPTRGRVTALHVTASHAEATNGHYLLRVPMVPQDMAQDWPTTAGPNGAGETPVEAMIPADTAAAILKAVPKKSYLPILEHAALYKVGDAVEGYTTDLEHTGTFKAPQAGDKFPDCDKVIPAADPDRTVSLSAEYLRDLCNYAIKYGPADQYKRHGITLQVGKDTAKDCLRIEIALPDGRTAIGALMPRKR